MKGALAGALLVPLAAGCGPPAPGPPGASPPLASPVRSAPTPPPGALPPLLEEHTGRVLLLCFFSGT